MRLRLLWHLCLPVSIAGLTIGSFAQKAPTSTVGVIPPELAAGPLPTTQTNIEKTHLAVASIFSADALRDRDTGQVKSVIGEIKLPSASNEKARVDRMLTLVMPRLSSPVSTTNQLSPALRFEAKTDSPSGSHYTYQQFYKGLPVWGGRVVVHQVGAGKAQQIDNGAKAFTSQSLDDSFGDRATAIKNAVGSIHFETLGPAAPEAEQGFLEVSGVPIATWRVRFNTVKPGGSWEVFVRGSDLKPISARNIASYQKAKINDPNPVVALQNPC